jgi:hypothetical protein
MGGVPSWIVRLLLVAVCGSITAQTIRIAVADWIATQYPRDGLDRALRLVPDDSALLVRAALLRSETGDMSPGVDQQLLHAREANPRNADVLIALGLREELRGHNAETERYLVRAAEIDHTFKPTWTLIDFYARIGRSEKTWPLIRRTLALDPLAFSPGPIFELCWSQTSDSTKILSLIPDRGTVLYQYLFYLLASKRIDAAVEAWPRVLNSMATEVPAPAAETLVQFPDYLIAANRLPDAVRAWNQLVDKKLVHSGRLDPLAGISVADPNFDFPLPGQAFAWRVASEAGLYVTETSSGVRFEFSGDEPESSVVLVTTAALIRDRSYRLVWKSDASDLSLRQDPGFAFRIVQEPGASATECPPLLAKGDEGVCPFISLPDATRARLELRYARAPGTTRAKGKLRMTTVRLEFAS